MKTPLYLALIGLALVVGGLAACLWIRFNVANAFLAGAAPALAVAAGLGIMFRGIAIGWIGK
jgi:hypothetical protein